MNAIQSLKEKSRKFGAISFTGLALLSVLGTAASADQDNHLKNWVKAADAAVDDVMKYPLFAKRNGQSGWSEFTVTIDRTGEIVASDLVASYGRRRLQSAAKRVLEKVEFPAIPSNYEDNRLTFRLQLSYLLASSASKTHALQRITRVRGEELPSAPSGRIEILSAPAD